MTNTDRMHCRHVLSSALLMLELWVIALVVLALTSGCALIESVTPADRARAYLREAQGISVLCKAYKFDRAAGLVGDVPEMARVCE